MKIPWMDNLIANESSSMALKFKLFQKTYQKTSLKCFFKVCEVDYCRMKMTK